MFLNNGPETNNKKKKKALHPLTDDVQDKKLW